MYQPRRLNKRPMHAGLHNERASEREADHYAEWRAGWEPHRTSERCVYRLRNMSIIWRPDS
jgi:hypothetical protein